MWKSPGRAVAVDASQLVVGLYVWLDLKWDEHAFLSNRFLIKSDKDIATIRSYQTTGRLYYHPDKSTARPPIRKMTLETRLADEEEQTSAAIISATNAALSHELAQAEKAKKDTYRQQRETAMRAERAWQDASRAAREGLLNMARSPKVAGEQLAQLSRKTATTIAEGQEILLHLLGDRKEQGPQFHALNTMTLCMLVGKKIGLSEQELSDLALGALAHDAGKALVAPQILKTWPRKKHEEECHQQHVQFSVELATKSAAFNPAALAVIADHHETLDGLGWPNGKKDVSVGARILALVDRYDRLCTPEAPGREQLMPAEALATMYKTLSGKVDTQLLHTLIKLLGIYPPGTLVQLNNEALALVISPGPNSLQPRVLLYSPELPKDQAPVLELSSDPELKIVESIKPSSLPPEVLQWLNPQQRLSYFFSVGDSSTG